MSDLGSDPMTGSRSPVGIVLAGGRSSRFGRDKLAEPIDGEPLLWRPIRALAAAGCVEILIVIPPTGGEPDRPPDVAPPIRLVRDREAFGGPLVGAWSGLAAVTERRSDGAALIVAGDQPSLVPAVLADLVERVRAGRQAAALADPSGRMRPLPMALAVAPAMVAATALLDSGERRLRALPTLLEADVVPLAIWRRLDPSAGTLDDVDEPTDLASSSESGSPAQP